MTPLEKQTLKHVCKLLNSLKFPHPSTAKVFSGEVRAQIEKEESQDYLSSSMAITEAQRWLEALLEETK